MHSTSRAISTLLLSAAVVMCLPRPAAAQMGVMSSQCKKKFSQESRNPITRRALKPGDPPDTPQPWITSDHVIIECDDAQLFADELEYYEETSVVKARGHVTFIEGNQRISADSLEFNTKTKLGTFYKAQGIMTVAGKADTTGMFSAADTDAYFYGEVIEKTGPDVYKFKNGVLTTCVQPTPRWQIEGTKVVLVRDRHALMWNAVMKVKNVPVMYLPFMYYPINKEGRSTGFLMPVYGHDQIRGQTFSEAFFLVLGRSMDATINYEFTSKTGSGYNGEYRYIQAPGSEGNVRVDVFNGKDAADPLLSTRRENIVGTLTQRLPHNWFLRANVNYTDNVIARGLLQQDLLTNTSSQRTAGANIQGGIGKIRLTGEAYVTDYFSTVNNTLTAVRTGRLPQIHAEWPSAPIGKTRIYFGMPADFSGVIRQDDINDPAKDRGLTRIDTHPTVRTSIGSLPYLTPTVTVGMDMTYWSEQLDSQGVQIKKGLSRQIADIRLDLLGPTFARIFDSPGSHYATRWKHVIQPAFSISRLTGFDDAAKVAKNEASDFIVGGTTNISYGLTNRLMAKRPAMGNQAVEVASIGVQQTYYSNSAASLADTNYSGTATLSSFSPIAIVANAQPTSAFNVNTMVFIDSKYKEVRSVSSGATLLAKTMSANLSWARTFFIDGLAGFDKKELLNQTLTAGANYRAPDNHLSGRFGWSYDFQNKHRLQQYVVVSYMSQCCGIAVSLQERYVGGFTSSLQQNRIFNISFSLAGIGTFSPTGLFR